MGDINQFSIIKRNADVIRGPTSKDGDIKPIDDSMCRAELSVSTGLRQGQYGLLRSMLIRGVRRLRLLPFIFDYRYLHPPVMINMVGQKRAR
ncbi:MAG: hypothetical protein ACE5Q3_09365 [Alphaproteobacteria bacterium]